MPMDPPPARDARPALQVRASQSWAWLRGLPAWLQVLAWVLGWWILPAWWLLGRARGPIGVGTATLVAVVGVSVMASAVTDDPSGGETGRGAVEAVEMASSEPASAAPSPSSTRTPIPSPIPSPSPSASPTEAPDPTTAPSPTVAPSPSPVLTATAEPEVVPAVPDPTPRRAAGRRTTVERIVDGDTLYLAGLPERARLIGIDTPETVKPNSPVECFGPEATSALEQLVPPGTEVRIVFDVERIDRYDRPLVYLYRVSDDLFVNRAMVRRGFAQVATFPPNVAHVEAFQRAQRNAREDSSGLWSADCEADTPVEASAPPAPSGRGDGSAEGGSSEGGGDGDVIIADIEWDGPGADVEFDTSEHVVLRNDGDEPVDVEGWSLTDLKDHRITIPGGYGIPAGAQLAVHTGPGDNTDSAYHDGASQAIWNNSGGDTATLRNADGDVVDEFAYSS